MMQADSSPPPSTIIKVGVVMIFVSLALFILNIMVVDQNTVGSFSDVKRTLRFLGNFLLSLQLIASLINCYWAYWGTNHLSFNSILIIILELISITISSIVMINNKRLLNVYIISSIVMMTVYIAREMKSNHFLNFYNALATLLISIVCFVYEVGVFIVLYNLMGVRVEEGQESEDGADPSCRLEV